MKITRIIRDLLLLAVAAVGLWSVYEIVNMFGRGDQNGRADDFSLVRRESDRRFDTGDWDAAAENYRKLTEDDPFNGMAWYRLGVSLRRLADELGPSTSGEPVENGNPPKLFLSNDVPPQSEREALLRESLAAFQQALDYPYYRNEARKNLAVINTMAGNQRVALDLLKEAVEDGLVTRSGLLAESELLALANVEGFQDVVNQERENARSMFSRRRSLPSINTR